MKVAMINRNPFTHPGGDVIMLRRLQAALQKLGVEADEVYGEWGPETLHCYDVIHLQHCNFTFTKEGWQKTLQSGVPYVVLPIFYPTDQLGMSFADMRQMFEGARAVVPLSFREAREITELTSFSGPFHVIPHGTEKRFHWDGTEDRSLLMCANARGDKGEQLVQQVARRLGVPFVYSRTIPHERMHLAYRQARVFVHSSPDDRMSLTIGEALCAGCRVISSDRDRGNEWFPGIKACNPESEDELYEYVRVAWESEQWDWRPNGRAREMTWELAAQKWLRVYREALR